MCLVYEVCLFFSWCFWNSWFFLIKHFYRYKNTEIICVIFLLDWLLVEILVMWSCLPWCVWICYIEKFVLKSNTFTELKRFLNVTFLMHPTLDAFSEELFLTLRTCLCSAGCIKNTDRMVCDEKFLVYMLFPLVF